MDDLEKKMEDACVHVMSPVLQFMHYRMQGDVEKAGEIAKTALTHGLSRNSREEILDDAFTFARDEVTSDEVSEAICLAMDREMSFEYPNLAIKYGGDPAKVEERMYSTMLSHGAAQMLNNFEWTIPVETRQGIAGGRFDQYIDIARREYSDKGYRFASKALLAAELLGDPDKISMAAKSLITQKIWVHDDKEAMELVQKHGITPKDVTWIAQELIHVNLRDGHTNHALEIAQKYAPQFLPILEQIEKSIVNYKNPDVASIK